MTSRHSVIKRNLARIQYKMNSVGIETVSARVYDAGWNQGEWTCCRCGLVIGKKNEPRSVYTYGEAGKHSLECGEENGSF